MIWVLLKNGKIAEYAVTFLMMAVIFVSANVSFCILKKNAVNFIESAFMTCPIVFVSFFFFLMSRYYC